MPVVLRRLGVALAALVLSSGIALAQSKVTLAIGGASCLCYLPTMLAKQLGEYEKAGVNVEVVEFKGGSEALKAVMGGSADVVSGYFDHCVNLAAKGQHLQSFVVYDRYPGFALVVSPKHAAEIKSIKDLANKKIGVSAPGSSTDWPRAQPEMRPDDRLSQTSSRRVHDNHPRTGYLPPHRSTHGQRHLRRDASNPRLEVLSHDPVPGRLQ